MPSAICAFTRVRPVAAHMKPREQDPDDDPGHTNGNPRMRGSEMVREDDPYGERQHRDGSRQTMALLRCHCRAFTGRLPRLPQGRTVLGLDTMFSI